MKSAKVTLWIEYDEDNEPAESDYAYFVEAYTWAEVRDWTVEVDNG